MREQLAPYLKQINHLRAIDPSITDKITEQTIAIATYYFAKNLKFGEQMLRQCLTQPAFRSALKYLIEYDLPLPLESDSLVSAECLNALQKIIGTHRAAKNNPLTLNNQTRANFGKTELDLVPEEHVLDQFFTANNPYTTKNLLTTSAKLRGNHFFTSEKNDYLESTAKQRAELTRPPVGLFEPQQILTKEEMIEKYRREKATIQPKPGR